MGDGENRRLRDEGTERLRDEWTAGPRTARLQDHILYQNI
jgi:hypothetical protein